MRRAQAAMEFLMTYGWAILVVLAAIGALAYFGVLSPDRFLPDKCIIQGGFSCSDEIIDSTVNPDEIRFKVINNLGITATGVNVTLTSTDCAAANSTLIVGQMDNRDVYQAVFVCSQALAGAVDGDITISYIRSDGTEARSATGTITGRPQ